MEYLIIFGLFCLFLIVFAFLKLGKKGGNKKIEQRNWENYVKRFDPELNKFKMPPIYTKVAGVTYQNDDTGEERQKIIAKAGHNEKLMLVPDELNRFDEDAIKVVRLNGQQIGFLNKDLSLEIKARLKKGYRVDARIVSITGEKPRGVNIELIKYSRRNPKLAS